MRRTTLIIFLAGLLAPIGIFYAVTNYWKLPEIHTPEVSIIYDAHGEIVQTLSERNDRNVTKDEIADIFTAALVAVEDRRFYKHHGIDPIGIIRAAAKNIRNGRIVEGGSTITQQTAKMLFLSNEQTFKRKILDMVYAVQMERKYSKDEILTLYCNAAYFGHGAYGIETAARTYFAKSAGELTLPEAALLAGLLQSPSNYDPYIYPEKAEDRQKDVLETMYQTGLITAEEKAQAENTPLEYHMSSSLSGDAPWVVDEIRQILIGKYGEERIYQGGLQIYTTLDLSMQRAANQAVQENLQAYEKDMQAALIAIEPGTGYIRAMVGGRDYRSSAYNRVYASRQPGSTSKPFIYSLAIEQGYTQADLIECREYSYTLEDGQVYTPADYGSEPYHNRLMTLREAVMRSDNAVAVYLHSRLTPQKSADYMEAFGLPARPVLSSVLGSVEASPVEMAAAYGVFASGGMYAEPVLILRVADGNGKVLEDNSPQVHQVIDENVACVVTDMLQSVMISPGTGAHLAGQVGRQVAAKTGTTDDFHDAWMTGFTPELVCSVWVGYDQEKDVNLTGSAIAGPIWAQFLGNALSGWSQKRFPAAPGVGYTTICMETGCIATESCPWTMQAAFLQGTEPWTLCWEHASQWDWLYQWMQTQEEPDSEAVPVPEPEEEILPAEEQDDAPDEQEQPEAVWEENLPAENIPERSEAMEPSPAVEVLPWAQEPETPVWEEAPETLPESLPVPQEEEPAAVDAASGGILWPQESFMSTGDEAAGAWELIPIPKVSGIIEKENELLESEPPEGSRLEEHAAASPESAPRASAAEETVSLFPVP